MIPDARQTLLRTLAANVGDPQPVVANARTLWTVTVANGPLTHHAAERAMRAARDDGHVLRWQTADGNLAYALTGDGIDATDHVDRPLFDAADRDALQAVIETEASRDDPRQEVIGWANRRLAALKGVAEA